MSRWSNILVNHCDKKFLSSLFKGVVYRGNQVRPVWTVNTGKPVNLELQDFLVFLVDLLLSVFLKKSPPANLVRPGLRDLQEESVLQVCYQICLKSHFKWNKQHH